VRGSAGGGAKRPAKTGRAIAPSVIKGHAALHWSVGIGHDKRLHVKMFSHQIGNHILASQTGRTPDYGKAKVDGCGCVVRAIKTRWRSNAAQTLKPESNLAPEILKDRPPNLRQIAIGRWGGEQARLGRLIGHR